jgi:hypothetical protein
MDYTTPYTFPPYKWEPDFVWLCSRLRFLLDNASDNILGVMVKGRLVFPDLIDVDGVETQALFDVEPVRQAVVNVEISKKIASEAVSKWMSARSKYPANHPHWKGKGAG